MSFISTFMFFFSLPESCYVMKRGVRNAQVGVVGNWVVNEEFLSLQSNERRKKNIHRENSNADDCFCTFSLPQFICCATQTLVVPSYEYCILHILCHSLRDFHIHQNSTWFSYILNTSGNLKCEHTKEQAAIQNFLLPLEIGTRSISLSQNLCSRELSRELYPPLHFFFFCLSKSPSFSLNSFSFFVNYINFHSSNRFTAIYVCHVWTN